MPPIERADFDALLELLDPATMQDVVRMFVASAPDRLRSAEAGVATGDSAAAAMAFHTLRSGCGQLGAHRLDALCAVAERSAKQGDLAGAAEQLTGIHAEYERCVAWFLEHRWLEA